MPQQPNAVCAICKKIYPAGEKHGPCKPDALIGTIFADKYEILSLLGEGGMSKVYKARHLLMKRIIAIKLLQESSINDEAARERFQLEAEAASALSHPNVVAVHDFGLTSDGRAFFIMDCLEGITLADLLLEKKELDLQQAFEIFTQACEGLDHAHRRGVIHRDVKPSNLVIVKQDDGSDLVKLVDFGIAKLLPRPEDGKKIKRLTQSGQIFGSPPYMSPEQCSGRPLDARSDIYSLGCLMYETLSGEPPLYGETFVTTAVKHVNETPKPLSEKSAQKVPPALEAVVMKCLQKRPAARYESAAELKQALFDAALSAGLKGLRIGAVAEPKSIGNSGSLSSAKIAIEKRARDRKRYATLAIIGLVSTSVLAGLSWFVFAFPGTEGDPGTVYEKLQWQLGLMQAERLTKEQKYTEAAKELENCKKLAFSFGDDNPRLETTLSKLVDAYTLNHDSENLENTNDDLVILANQRVFREYDSLTQKLKEWEIPTTSSVKWEERAQQAAAFAERISRCADKLSVRSQAKQEALLKRAANTFDLLNLREGVFRTRFRLQLAEIYKAQNRINDEKEILSEALAHAAQTPLTDLGWRLKIQTSQLLGELDSNDDMLEKGRSELENAVQMARQHLPSEAGLLRSCINATARNYHKFHSKECDEKAKALEDEANEIGRKLDEEEEKVDKN